MTADPRQERSAPISIALLKPCILAHLLGGSAYGYELHHRLVSVGLGCDLGTVYRALNTLENDGLLRSTWERSQEGRSRHRFELTQAGADTVDMYVPAVEQLLSTARSFLDMRCHGGGSAPPLRECSAAELRGSPSEAPARPVTADAARGAQDAPAG
jgi:DNA-binding PadR family transcriptional regulator